MSRFGIVSVESLSQCISMNCLRNVIGESVVPTDLTKGVLLDGTFVESGSR